ncbi:FAD-dependent oxidoreductase [Amnibacterium sp.]|uniref:FAD-dependent oxidoreductase n=1 Tax=Amnibacterium sp. TaxID=1872496 RepID=UPI00261703C8|nr:FAD-dependent oxidoreductase [Amnibacterium sp.]MCU1474721.1 FAD-dependent oxidoreductase [Amnibacterium sp.]
MAHPGPTVLVVGAGVVGLTTAVLLAERGIRVEVVTAEPVGGGSTGRSAGVVSQLHGTAYRRLRGETALKNAVAYRQANEAGFAWIERFVQRREVPFEQRDAYVVAGDPASTRRIDDEHLAARRAGLAVEKLRRPTLPVPAFGALRLPGQLLLDPRVLLDALASEARELGVSIHEGERVVDVDVRTTGPCRVITPQAVREADSIVLATGTPILDRGLYAFKTQPYRILAVHGAGTDPGAPIVTSVTAGGSTTVATSADGGVTLTGGAHPTGVDLPESRHLAAVERFASAHLDGFTRDAAWSGQDYRPFNPIAFVGLLPASAGRVRFATGFDGWGLTHGAAAAIRIAREIADEPKLEWSATIGRRVTRPRSGRIGASADAAAAARRVVTPLRVTATDRRLLAEGQGIVHRTDRGITATSRVDGLVRSVSGVCTRLGGALAWNDVEHSWDCPVCGSRFAPDGAVLEGGARGALARYPDPADWGGAAERHADPGAVH